VLAFVGPRRVRLVARQAHMRRFSLDPAIWGLSRIDADDQARFFLHIDDRVAPRHRRAAMRLLSSVVPEQRWGVGRVHLAAGWRLYFKGGWGSGTGAVDHQVADRRRAARVDRGAHHRQPEPRLWEGDAARDLRPPSPHPPCA
jgi:hypothetical protein